MASTREIAVMMPFGGTDKDLNRLWALRFLRLKHLIEKRVQVVSAENKAETLQYHCGVSWLKRGNIDEAVAYLMNSDVVVGMVFDKNLNVLFEMTVRNVLCDMPILIVRGDRDDLLPKYLAKAVCIDYPAEGSSVVERLMAKIAHRSRPFISVDSPIPAELAKAIDENDEQLASDLQDALTSYETKPRERPEFITKVAPDVHPSEALSSWEREEPYSIVQVNWLQQSLPVGYQHTDLARAPFICSCNDAFRRLYGFPDSVATDKALTCQFLLELLEKRKYVSSEDLGEFVKDQAEVGERIIFGGAAGSANVPLRIGRNHQDPGFRNRRFMPCVIAKKTVGRTDRPHRMYLIVVYLDVTNITPARRHRRKVQS